MLGTVGRWIIHTRESDQSKLEEEYVKKDMYECMEFRENKSRRQREVHTVDRARMKKRKIVQKKKNLFILCQLFIIIIVINRHLKQ